MEDEKEEIESVSIRNTILEGGIEKIVDVLKNTPKLKVNIIFMVREINIMK